MSYQHVYTVDRLPPKVGEGGESECFRVAKHTKKAVIKNLPFTAEEGAYEVTRKQGGGVLFCDCFAGLMGKQCRHIEMVLIAEDAEALNTGRYYDYDKKRWLDTPIPKTVETV